VKEAGVYSPFQRRYRSQAFRLARRGSIGDPFSRSFFRVIKSIPGFTYVGIGPIAVWRDGLRTGIGRR